MTWLVVGASGQLGKSVSKVLDERGIDFTELNRDQGSLSNQVFVKDFVEKIQTKVIVNCAAWTDVDGAETNESGAALINSDAVGNLAAAARNNGAIFAHVSTDYVFSGIGNKPWDEDGLKQPLSAYGRTKAAGEDLLFCSEGESSYIFRTAWLYSSYGKNFAKTMVRLALKDSAEVKVVTDQIGQPTFAGDLANQMVDSVVQRIPFGIYHGTNSGQTSWFEFAREIFRLVDADVGRVKPVTSEAFPRPAKRPAYSVLGHDKWKDSGVEEMRDWKVALSEAMPTIISAVKAEG
jgi:dTDP-4-dehydrorhamnose reductase